MPVSNDTRVRVEGFYEQEAERRSDQGSYTNPRRRLDFNWAASRNSRATLAGEIALTVRRSFPIHDRPCLTQAEQS